MANQIRIAMWSGPRNISTAMMRSFENRPDTVVDDEPFYAHYLLKTRVDHPLREQTIASQEHDWYIISERLTSDIPNGKTTWYQKHMAQHNLPGYDLEWTKKMVNCFLIRDPREVILSFQSKFDITSALQLGFMQQLELFNKLKDETGKIPPVINAKDVLTDTVETLKILCVMLGIPFRDEMLLWPRGPRKNDGVWGKYWYKNVEVSTGFQQYQEKEGKIPNNLKDIYQECCDAYMEINSYKISSKSLVS